MTRIINTNNVEFYFENINLPFDDANNDGYVAFKIKTWPTLVSGNSFSNTASIYFDYNAPIITNTATTYIQTLGTEDFTTSHYISLHPNPATSRLDITKKDALEFQKLEIDNMLGQTIVAIPNAQNLQSVDVSILSPGNYILKIISDKGVFNAKFIKK